VRFDWVALFTFYFTMLGKGISEQVNSSVRGAVDAAHIYHVRDLRQTLELFGKLDSESADVVVGLALVLLLRDDGGGDLYVYANLENPTAATNSRILGTLQEYGSATDLSFDDVAKNPRLGGVFSGTLGQIELVFASLVARYQLNLFSG
jgi:hypothetical protein